jgi:hypothetical protein
MLDQPAEHRVLDRAVRVDGGYQVRKDPVKSVSGHRVIWF